MKTRVVTSVALVAAAVACGDDNPVRPTPTALQYLIWGSVSEPVGVDVRDFTLRVVDGDGTRTYRIGGPEYRAGGREGPVTIEITKDGYHPESQSTELRAAARVDFEIDPVTPPAAFSGPYWITLTADAAACASIPAALRTRRYAVDVEQEGARLTVHMSDAKLTGEETVGEIHGADLEFNLWAPSWYYYEGDAYTLEERLDDTRRLIIAGFLQASVRDTESAGQVKGTWAVLHDDLDAQSCDGVHGVRFTRR